MLLASVGGCGGGHEAEIDWRFDLDAALAAARSANKPLMIDFMAEWCPPCRAMEDSTFNDPVVIQRAASFVTLRIDVDKQREVAIRYNGNARKYGGVGIPNILFMTAGETKLKHIIGFQGPQQLIAVMDSVLDRFESIRHLESGLESIRPMDPYSYCSKLASDEFAGRLTGHEGYTAAARWAAGKFGEWGLEPIDGGNGYLQAYHAPYTIVDNAEMTLLLPGERRIDLELMKDFIPMLFSDTGDTTAGLVFAGWGIHAPDLGYDDYEGLDVDGKFVLCFRGTPDRKNKAFDMHDQHRHRMKTASDRGALGLIYIYREPMANPNGDWLEGFTPAIISEATADTILETRNRTSADLKGDLREYGKPLSFLLDARIHFRVQSTHYPDGVGYNVVGYIKGSDPALEGECLVIGGHLDHCGRHMGLVFTGAQDNASGSATVMEIAEAFSKIESRPRRPVVFVLFGGEEKGLEGSYYFAGNLPAPFTKVGAMFNFDMTGQGAGTNCGYSFDVPELKSCLEAADEYVHTLQRTREIKQVGVRSSDYAPFFLGGAACVGFWSNGPHMFYHKTGDTIYRINPDIMADIARLAFITAYWWADRGVVQVHDEADKERGS
jgi:thiol-disulfide isomerase/thioredoxin